MTTCNISENDSENKSVRIHFLEQQVRLMRSELRHIRKDLVPQEDLRRFRNLSDKLNELNSLLYELRNNYRRLQQPRKLRNAKNSLRDNNYLKQRVQQEHNMTGSQHQKRNFVDEKNLILQHQLGGEEKKFEEKEIQTINVGTQIRNEKIMTISEPRKQELHDNYTGIRDEKRKTVFELREQEIPDEKHSLIPEDKRSPVEEVDAESNRFDQQKLKATEELSDKNKQEIRVELNSKKPFKSCQQLMDEIRTPGSILGNYLMKLQDFRTDPDLRRQRLEKKRKEKMELQQQKQNMEKEKKVSDEGIEIMNYSSKESIPSSSTKKHEYPTEAFKNIPHCDNQKSNMPRPPEVRKCIKSSPKSLDYVKNPCKTQTFTSETQTESNEYSDPEMTRNEKCYGFFGNNQSSEDPNLQFTSTSQSSSIQQSDSDSSQSKNLPLIHKNLQDVVYSIVQNINPNIVALTVVLETDNLYHINISVTTTGQSLSCLYATEAAVRQAKLQNLFTNFLTFFVVNSDNTLGQKDRILGHSFEFERREN